MRARLLLLASALVAFGASLGSGFHFDDYAIFSTPLRAALRQPGPLTNLTLWLNYQIAGTAPFSYHAVNLLLHLAAVLLAYAFLRRWIGERPALIAAAIFAVHPLQAEAVNYISARAALLATALSLAGCLFVGQVANLRADCQSAHAAVPNRRAAWQAALLAAACFLLALLAVAGVPRAAHPGTYLLSQGVVIWHYLRLLVFPWGFTVDPDIPVPPLWLGALAWLAILGAAIGLWRLRKPWATWLLAGLLLLLPTSLFPARDLAADYRMYLPMLGFAAAAGLLLARIPRRGVAIGLVAVLTLLSVTRTYVWMSEERLWREAVRRAPEKARPKIELARTVRAAEALELLARARQLDPHDPEIPAETGKILLDEGQAEAALAEFNSALALDPRNAVNLNNRGVALASLGQNEAARMDFEQALALDPAFAEARENLTRLSVR